jgi:hypothetical protein
MFSVRVSVVLFFFVCVVPPWSSTIEDGLIIDLPKKGYDAHFSVNRRKLAPLVSAFIRKNLIILPKKGNY